jgi:ubiquinone/menaquinone biosynthesis C-methylase UbiE
LKHSHELLEEIKVHIDYLKSLCNLTDRKVVDVGAGDGTYSRQLQEAGARVIGIEIDPAKVERARSNLPDSITVLEGWAEKLPLGDQSQDLACFFFSFHHVPIDIQEDALSEIRRVLKSDGRLHVVEPLPYGTMFDVVRMLEDEMEVRTHSHSVMRGLGETLEFKLIDFKEYILTREYPDFDAFLEKVVLSDPERSAVFPKVKYKMEKAFHAASESVGGRNVLHQPCIAYHFTLSG